jgi:hypothetical protein
MIAVLLGQKEEKILLHGVTVADSATAVCYWRRYAK